MSTFGTNWRTCLHTLGNLGTTHKTRFFRILNHLQDVSKDDLLSNLFAQALKLRLNAFFYAVSLNLAFSCTKTQKADNILMFTLFKNGTTPKISSWNPVQLQVMSLWNGLQSHSKASVKKIASNVADASARCNSTVHKIYKLIWERSRSVIADASL